MASVADHVRIETDLGTARLSASERVVLALRLGEQAADTYASANGVSLEEAKLALRRSSQSGRRPSGAASLDD